MKTLRITALLFLLCLTGMAYAQQFNFEWQEVQRPYIVRLPASTYDDTPPVLFFLHGLGDNIARVDSEYHFSALADRFGWVMVVPQARNQGGYSMWNAAMYSSDIDDVGFLMALLDTLTTQHHLDPDSVFFTGFSMGGFMTHRMAIEKGDRLTACAPVSGLITFAMSNVTPVAPVRMLHIHGTNDPVVGYDGGSQYFGGTLGLGVEAIIDYWKAANHCEGEPAIDSLPDLKNDGLRFVRYTYDCGTDFQHLKVIGGNHTWYLNSNQTDIAYLDEIHAFFTGTQQGTTGSAEQQEEGLWMVPNPSSGIVEIRLETAGIVTVVNVQGQQVYRRQLPSGTTQLDLSACPPGLYFVKGPQSITAKLVRQ